MKPLFFSIHIQKQSGRIPHGSCALPLLRIRHFRSLGLVIPQKTYQLIGIDPDFPIPLFLRFVKDQLYAEMEMNLIDIIDIFRGAVAGMPHVSNDIPGRYNASFLESFRKRIILPQVRVVIITFFVKAPDSDAPAAILIPAKSLHISGLDCNDGCTDMDIILYKQVCQKLRNNFPGVFLHHIYYAAYLLYAALTFTWLI